MINWTQSFAASSNPRLLSALCLSLSPSERGQSPVEWVDFPSVRPSIRPSVHYPLWAIQPGLRPSQLGLRPSQSGLRTTQLGLRTSQPDLRPSQPASQASGFRHSWLGLRPGWMAQRGGRTDGRLVSKWFKIVTQFVSNFRLKA